MPENEQIRKQLENDRDAAFTQLLNTKLTDELQMEYEQMGHGRGFPSKDDDPDVAKLLEYLEDPTLNDRFENAVKGIAQLPNTLIIDEFYRCLKSVFKPMKENRYEVSTRAVFIEYDYYGHKHAWVGAFGNWDGWKIMKGDNYFKGDWYRDKVFELAAGITFENAWPAQVETEFDELDDELGLDITNRLTNLYQLNARVLLHDALKQLDDEGELNFLEASPFHFYINEHDSQISSLYIK